ncbi:MAG: hypothetical protein HYY68_00975, partial [Thaumarchaeota archaeon]|nr:hypothetical protein [Nitrososphaerota archaeon]
MSNQQPLSCLLIAFLKNKSPSVEMQLIYSGHLFHSSCSASILSNLNLIWFEAGRIELLRSIGLSYRDVEKRGLLLPVVEAKANYHAPAHFDDEVLV